MTELSWSRFQKLDEGLTLAGCKHTFRKIEMKEKGGVTIFGLPLRLPQTTYKTYCNLKHAECGFPCPKGINRSKLNAIHREAKSL